MLHILDLLHQLGGALRGRKQLVEQLRGRAQMLGELVEEAEELFVSRNKTAQHALTVDVCVTISLRQRYRARKGLQRHSQLSRSLSQSRYKSRRARKGTASG